MFNLECPVERIQHPKKAPLQSIEVGLFYSDSFEILNYAAAIGMTFSATF